MYIEQEGKEFVVLNDSGFVIATRKSQKDAERFIKSEKGKRKANNGRRNEKITYSSRSDD